MTNQQTGATQKDCNEVVILRHEAIPYAFDSSLWEKYKLGEFAKITDPKTNAPSVRNMFWKPAEGDFAVPGIGNVQIGINELQDSGVMFGVCAVAIMVNSHVIAQKQNADPEVVQKELMAGILPGIQVLPSGVWAVGRAQEHGCAYCFAG
jgi:intracellular sulfur oxidation DsrE/DsrF family protein